MPEDIPMRSLTARSSSSDVMFGCDVLKRRTSTHPDGWAPLTSSDTIPAVPDASLNFSAAVSQDWADFGVTLARSYYTRERRISHVFTPCVSSMYASKVSARRSQYSGGSVVNPR